MINPLLEALQLASVALKQSDNNPGAAHHIIIISSTLYIDSLDISSILNDFSISVFCKKGLKPLEALSPNSWKFPNPAYTILIDKAFIPELNHLSSGTPTSTQISSNQTNGQTIPASVTFGAIQPGMQTGMQQQHPQQPPSHISPPQPLQMQQPNIQADYAQYPQYPPDESDAFAAAPLWSGQLQMNEVVSHVIATPISKHELPQFHCHLWPPTLSIFGLYTVNIHTLQGYVQSNHIPIVSLESSAPHSDNSPFMHIKRSLQEQRKVAIIKQDQYHGFCIFMNNNRLLGLVMIKSQFPPDILQCLGYSAVPTSQPNNQQIQQPQQLPPSQPSVSNGASPLVVAHQPQQQISSPHMYAQPIGSPRVQGMQYYRGQPQQVPQYRNMPVYAPTGQPQPGQQMYQQMHPGQAGGQQMQRPQYRTPYGMMQYPMMQQMGQPGQQRPQMGQMQQMGQMGGQMQPGQMQGQPGQMQQQMTPGQTQMNGIQQQGSPGMPQQMQGQPGQMNNQQMAYMPQYYQQGMPPQYRRPQ